MKTTTATLALFLALTITMFSQIQSRHLNKRFEIAEGKYGTWMSTLTDIGAQKLRMHVKYEAHGGTGNDVVVAVIHAKDWPNFTNGHQVDMCYSSPGPQTVGDFTASYCKGPGIYYLVFDARGTSAGSKSVDAEIWSDPIE